MYIFKSGPESVLKLVSVSVASLESILATPLVECAPDLKSPLKDALAGGVAESSLPQATNTRQNSSKGSINKVVEWRIAFGWKWVVEYESGQ